MAMPNDRLSTTATFSQLVGARAPEARPYADREDGGIALNDPSAGHLYQEWRTVITLGTLVTVEADNSPPTTLYSGTNITEASATFDQNMRPVLAFVEDGLAKLRWYDTQVGAQVVTEYPDVHSPRVALDDKRVWQTQRSDVVFAYIRAGGLYYRQQRDRYSVERLLAASLPGNAVRLERIAFGANHRLHFVLRSLQYLLP